MIVWSYQFIERVSFIGAVSIAMSFWECLSPRIPQQQIIYLEPINDLMLTEDDYGYQWLEEANLKVEFEGFDKIGSDFL